MGAADSDCPEGARMMPRQRDIKYFFIPKPYSPLPLGQPINAFAPNGELGFILMLRFGKGGGDNWGSN